MPEDRHTSINAMTAWSACAVLVIGAFTAASLTAESGWLSLTPPPTDLDPTPKPDVAPQDAVVLYQSAYTAWAALLLTMPAMATVWLRKRSATAAQIWHLFWTVGFVAFLIHMIWSMGVFFGGDFEWMTTSSRVSAFWPGIIFLIWWAIDVTLAWSRTEDRVWIGAQRALLHIVAFVLFVGGSLVKGETVAIKVLGAVFVIASIGGAIRWLLDKRAS